MQSHYLPLYLTQMDPKTISHSVNNYLVSTWPMQARRESPSPLPQPHASSALLSPTQALRRGGWKASFEELDDVDHFEIIWNLTQKDYVLTQVGCVPSLRMPGVLSQPRRIVGGQVGSTEEPLSWLFGTQEAVGPDGGLCVRHLPPTPHLPLK